jgi:hypothetical protein
LSILKVATAALVLVEASSMLPGYLKKLRQIRLRQTQDSKELPAAAIVTSFSFIRVSDILEIFQNLALNVGCLGLFYLFIVESLG